MEELRKIPLVVACAALLLVVLIEAGASLFLPSASPNVRQVIEAQNTDPPPNIEALQKARDGQDNPPGLSIPAMVWLDGLLLLTVGMLTASLIVPARILGRIQAPIRLVISFLMILAAIVVLIKDFVLLLLMVSLLLAAPFGTIAYLVMWGFFDRGGAATVLSLIMFLKLVFVVAMIVARPAFLKGKFLVTLTLVSLLANVIVGFLQGFVPGILVSITDAVGGIVVAILAIIFGLATFIAVIVPTIKSIRLEKESS